MLVSAVLTFAFWWTVLLKMIKKKGFTSSTFLISIYTLSFLCSVLLIILEFQQKNPKIDNYFGGYLFLTVSLWLYLYPFIEINDSNFEYLRIPSKKIIKCISVILSVCSIYSIVFYLPVAYKMIAVDIADIANVRSMVTTGNTLMEETKTLSGTLTEGIEKPLTTIGQTLQSMQESLKNIDAAQTALQNACKNINEVVASDNQTIKAAKTAAKNSSDSIAASIKTLEAKYAEISDKNSEEAKQLQSSINALKSAKASTDSVQNLKELTGIDTTKMPTIDVDSLKAGAATIMTNAATLQKSSEALSKALPELKKQLKSIEDAEGVLAQAGQLSTLTGSVDQLNAGMQGLNSAIGTLHSNLATLNNATSAQFPTAIKGITALNKGFAQLSGYNDSLVGGANKLRSNSPTLVAGVNTLKSGTNQLASGLNTLGSQMSSGSATLAANSGALRSGVSELQSGAKELAEGMAKFDKEGTSKLKSTVEDELGDVIDRIDVLTSEDCKYNTFSGKDKAMDGNVKFVIETDAIE